VEKGCPPKKAHPGEGDSSNNKNTRERGEEEGKGEVGLEDYAVAYHL